MRNAESKRIHQKAKYTRYKNNWFLLLIKEATRIEYWTEYNIKRLKNLRIVLELDYKIPINFFSAFVYYSTYNYMHWQYRTLNFSNYIGFISNEISLVEFSNFIAKKSLSWREKNLRWPDDWVEKWGIKTSVKGQKLGKNDKFVEKDIMSDEIIYNINKYR